jgi:hypothetical protein
MTSAATANYRQEPTSGDESPFSPAASLTTAVVDGDLTAVQALVLRTLLPPPWLWCTASPFYFYFIILFIFIFNLVI